MIIVTWFNASSTQWHPKTKSEQEIKQRLNRHSIKGRGGPVHKLNNNYQQSSQEDGDWDSGCFNLLANTPTPPTRSGSSLHPILCLLHQTNAFYRQPKALKDTQATFFSAESFSWMQPPPQSSAHYFQPLIKKKFSFFSLFVFCLNCIFLSSFVINKSVITKKKRGLSKNMSGSSQVTIFYLVKYI